MKCPKCGSEIADNAKFCTSCGANISESLAEQGKIEVSDSENAVAEVENVASEAENNLESVVSEVGSNVENEEPKSEVIKEPKVEDVKEESTAKDEANQAKFTKKTKEVKKEKKKKHTGLKVILILLLIIIILIAGCYGLYKLEVLPESISSIFEKVEEVLGKKEDDEKDDDKKDDEKENTVSNEVKNKEEIAKIDEDEDLVFDAIEKTIGGNTYKVPEINVDSVLIESCNKEIKGYVESELKLYEKATKLPDDAIKTCNYYWAQNDNILSVVFFIGKQEYDEYHVYNVDVYTGDIIVNSEILEAAKIDESTLAEKGAEAVEDFYKNYAFDASLEKYKTTKEYNDSYKATIGKGNFDRYMKMFLNKNGELCVIAKISIPGKYSSDDVIINVENKKRNSKQIIEGTMFPIKELKIAEDDTLEEKTEVKDVIENNTDAEDTKNTENVENTVVTSPVEEKQNNNKSKRPEIKVEVLDE